MIAVCVGNQVKAAAAVRYDIAGNLGVKESIVRRKCRWSAHSDQGSNENAEYDGNVTESQNMPLLSVMAV
jgi:hypothetical protein